MNRIGVYGLGVMGSSLARNIMEKGIKVAVFNIEPEVTNTLVKSYPAMDGYTDLKDFVNSLEKPRKIILMVTAGDVVDTVIKSLKPLLDKGDILIDCGNSFYKDSERRMQELKDDGLYLIGSGVSGGEKGALLGPSIMPSGDVKAYEEIRDIFTAVAAKNADGSSCCTYIGKKGSGHFVKMVHNGIEYADMQLIAEFYGILKRLYSDDKQRIRKAFKQFNTGSLKSYLLDITIDILNKQEDGEWLLDKVLDVAKQKGTGKWTAMASLEYDVPVPSLLEAVEARFLSSMKEERTASQGCYKDKKTSSPDVSIEADLKHAMLLAKTSIYAQGFSLIGKVNEQRGYGIDLKQLAVIWQNGCIIKSGFLNDIYKAYAAHPDLKNLLVSKEFAQQMQCCHNAAIQVARYAVQQGLYVPVLTSALNYFHGYTTEILETNLIQAQRDCFGAHTYQRNDQEGVFHSEWQE